MRITYKATCPGLKPWACVCRTGARVNSTGASANPATGQPSSAPFVKPTDFLVTHGGGK